MVHDTSRDVAQREVEAGALTAFPTAAVTSFNTDDDRHSKVHAGRYSMLHETAKR